MNVQRRLLVRAVILVGAVPLTLLTLSTIGCFPWSAINCTQIDLDLNCGRTRRTSYLLGMAVARSVEDSAVTRALSPDDRANSRADWRPVSTFSPGLNISPHYRLHGATFQIRELEICWEFGKMTPEARRGMARQVLRLYRQTGSCFRAEHYIQAVSELAQEADKRGKSMDVRDLPDP
jgi:hypothetical protein